MRFESVYVAATGRWLPEPTTIEAADRAGLVSRRAIWRTRIESVCISADLAAPEMAARAGRVAVGRAGREADDVALVLHASTSYQGHDLWPAASYVQREVLGNRCPAIEVDQMSNGGLAALELGAAYLAARGRGAALVTTGDRFPAPGWDRWLSDRGTIFADGGTAAVLDTRGGLARVLSVVTVSDSSLERMNRGDDSFGEAPHTGRTPIDLDATRAAFVAAEGLDGVMGRIEEGHRLSVKEALAEADTELDGIDRVVLPNLGMARLHANFLAPLGLDVERTTWSFGRRLGHLGAGDQIAGLDHLVETGALVPGRRYLLLGVGAGFSWSAAVLEAC